MGRRSDRGRRTGDPFQLSSLRVRSTSGSDQMDIAHLSERSASRTTRGCSCYLTSNEQTSGPRQRPTPKPCSCRSDSTPMPPQSCITSGQRVCSRSSVISTTAKGSSSSRTRRDEPAVETQDVELADGSPYHHLVGRLAVKWGVKHIGDCGYSSVGAVVGGTFPVKQLRCGPYSRPCLSSSPDMANRAQEQTTLPQLSVTPPVAPSWQPPQHLQPVSGGVGSRSGSVAMMAAGDDRREICRGGWLAALFATCNPQACADPRQ